VVDVIASSSLSSLRREEDAFHATFAINWCTIRTMPAPYPGDLLVHLSSFVLLLDNVRAGLPSAFERTAQDLRVDRSVLRRRIATLSAWIGSPLLRGRGSRMLPTEAGSRLDERARTILALTRELSEEVRSARERIILACTGTVTTQLVPSVLLELERSRPTRLEIRRAGGAACERLVRNGDVDLGVVRSSAPPRDLVSQHLTDDRLWLVVPARARRRNARRISLDEMAALPLVLYGSASRTRMRVMERLGPLGANVRVEVDGRSSALAYVRAGIGATFLSLLPGHVVDEPGVDAHDVTASFPPSRFYVIGRRASWSEPTVQDVVARLVRHARHRKHPR
jgi:LysR family nitrogen assimilation transcriptional regulator